MFKKLKLAGWVSLACMIGGSALAQNTVNVKPGDNIDAAIAQAGAGGTVIFAPGVYDIFPSDETYDRGFLIGQDLAGISFIGAGPGFDPATASILDGNSGFLGSAFELEADDVTVAGFTLTGFWDDALEIDAGNNVEIRDCWIIANKNGIVTENEAGTGATPQDLSQAVRIVNCVIGKGLDLIRANDTSFMALINCDIRDSGGDILEPEDSSQLLLRNCIIDRSYGGRDLQADGSSLITIDHCVFYGPPGTANGADIGAQFNLLGAVTLDAASIFANPMYTSVNFDVSINDYDFRLQPGSPALTAGIDASGNPTYAGSGGPAQ